MGRPLTTGTLVKTPTVKLTIKAGTKFIGVLKKSEPSKFGKLFTFSIEESDAPITMKDTAGIEADVDVKPGDDVALFASGQLHDALAQAQIGERVGIKFIDKKLNPKSGRYFNDFKASVLDKEEVWD
jgi:hypothetical protein